jgi:hypothetical protein
MRRKSGLRGDRSAVKSLFFPTALLAYGPGSHAAAAASTATRPHIVTLANVPSAGQIEALMPQIRTSYEWVDWCFAHGAREGLRSSSARIPGAGHADTTGSAHASDNSQNEERLRCRRATGRISVTRAAVNECPPDALDFDRPLKLQDVVRARAGRCLLKARLARCDPALGYRIIPFAEIDQARLSSLRSPLAF